MDKEYQLHVDYNLGASFRALVKTPGCEGELLKGRGNETLDMKIR